MTFEEAEHLLEAASELRAQAAVLEGLVQNLAQSSAAARAAGTVDRSDLLAEDLAEAFVELVKSNIRIANALEGCVNCSRGAA